MSEVTDITDTDRVKYAVDKLKFWIENLERNLKHHNARKNEEMAATIRHDLVCYRAALELLDGTDDAYIYASKGV